MKTIKTKIVDLQKNDYLENLILNQYVNDVDEESLQEAVEEIREEIEQVSPSGEIENYCFDLGQEEGYKDALKDVLALFNNTLEDSLIGFKEGDGQDINNLLLSEQLKLLRERQIETSEAIGKIELAILKNSIN